MTFASCDVFLASRTEQNTIIHHTFMQHTSPAPPRPLCNSSGCSFLMTSWKYRFLQFLRLNRSFLYLALEVHLWSNYIPEIFTGIVLLEINLPHNCLLPAQGLKGYLVLQTTLIELQFLLRGCLIPHCNALDETD